MTFTLDTKHSSTLTADSRSANATFTVDSPRNNYSITWGMEQIAWSAETRTWSQLTTALSLDTRN